MDFAIILANQILIMFVLMGVGFFLDRRGLISQGTVKELTNILFQVVVSCSILNAFQADYSPEMAKNLALSLLLATLALSLGAIVSTLIFGTKSWTSRISIFACTYPNSIFMGFPLLYATFGDIGIFYGTAYFAVYNPFLWSHGVSVVSDEDNLSLAMRIKKVITTPAIVAVITGFTFYITGIRFPSFISEPITYIASLNTPLSMIILGVFISKCNFRSMFSDKRVIQVAAVKLFLIPIIFIALLYLINIFYKLDQTMVLSTIICTATCTATTAALFAQQYGRDVDFAIKVVTLTTILCAVTLPLMILFTTVII